MNVEVCSIAKKDENKIHYCLSYLRQQMLLEFLKNSYQRNQIVWESATVCSSDKILIGEVAQYDEPDLTIKS